jgi:hypothetical protein
MVYVEYSQQFCNSCFGSLLILLRTLLSGFSSIVYCEVYNWEFLEEIHESNLFSLDSAIL